MSNLNLDLHKPYKPHVAINGMPASRNSLQLPHGFRGDFEAQSNGIYPEDVRIHLLETNYDPVIASFTFSGQSKQLPLIGNQLKGLRPGLPDEAKLLLAISPTSLKRVKDYHAYKAGAQAQSCIEPSEREQEMLQAFEDRINKSLPAALALWGLRSKLDVEAIEHPAVEDWIAQGRRRFPEEETFGGTNTHRADYFIGVKRDGYALSRIGEIRPDVIVVDAARAIKLDMLLNRDGSKTFHHWDKLFRLKPLLDIWKQAHQDYRNEQDERQSAE